MGQWQALGNRCGDCVTELGAGHYTVNISSWGYVPRRLEADIADPGIITSQLERAVFKPTRDEIINIKGNFLNLFDAVDMPIWDAFIPTLIEQGKTAELADWYSRLRAAETTHINLPISYNYNENLGWAPRYPLDGMDYTFRLDDYAAIVKQVQGQGFIPTIKLAFDGQFFDTTGWTYGWQWGMDNIERIANSLSEFNDNVLWSTGYDGCFPNWSPTQTTQMLQKMRSVLGDKACIDTQFSGPGSVGYSHMGKSTGDWVPDSLGILDSFSAMVLWYPTNLTGVQQIASRLLGPAAKNIEETNKGVWYLQQMSQIKKINISIFETPAAFTCIRKQMDSQTARTIATTCKFYGFESFGNGQPV
jgi:hypothetical protein